MSSLGFCDCLRNILKGDTATYCPGLTYQDVKFLKLLHYNVMLYGTPSSPGFVVISEEDSKPNNSNKVPEQ